MRGGMRVFHRHDSESSKSYQDSVDYGIDELTVRGGQSAVKSHLHSASVQVSEFTLFNVNPQLFETLFINEEQVRSADRAFSKLK